MQRRRTPWTKSEVKPQENNPKVEDTNAAEILFVDPGLPERPDHFWHGVFAGAVIVIACCFGINFLLEELRKDRVSLAVLRSAIEGCSEMINYRSYFETVTNYNQDSKYGRPGNLAVMVNGSVESGFDMRKALIEVFEGERMVDVILPHGRIQRISANLVSDGKESMRVYDQHGGLATRTFTSKERNEIVSSSMKDIRRRASGEWGIVRKAEESASNVYKSVISVFSYDVRVTFTDDVGKLEVSEGVSANIMKCGGRLIMHHAEK